MKRHVPILILAALGAACGDTHSTAGCLSTGDQSCLDWSDGQDAQVTSLPHDEEGSGIRAYTREGTTLSGAEQFQAERFRVTAEKGTFAATVDQDTSAAGTKSHPLGDVVSKDRWFTVTQDVSYGKHVGGCVMNRVTNVKRNTRNTLKGQKQPLLDIHSVQYTDEAGRSCWGVYDSGNGSTGPGVCFWEDKNNKAPPAVRKQAVNEQLNTIRPPNIDPKVWILVAFLVPVALMEETVK